MILKEQHPKIGICMRKVSIWSCAPHHSHSDKATTLNSDIDWLTPHNLSCKQFY